MVVKRTQLPTDAAAYKAAREIRGTQTQVAEALGISRTTIAKRETGAVGYPISREAALALLSLPTNRLEDLG